MRHLIMRLESPLMAFGGEAIDNLGVIRSFPAASMLTGMLANALGWRRVEAQRHQDLQDRLVFAARIDREPHGEMRLTDYQTVQIGDSVDMYVRSGHWVIGWTTRGDADERAGALGASGSRPFTHQRWRDYWADAVVTVALRLEPDASAPRLDDLAEALQEPARPLYIGRKPCLPSTPLFAGFCDGTTTLAALLRWPIPNGLDAAGPLRLLWPDGEGAAEVNTNQRYMLTDQRNWVSGLHGGGRVVCEGVTDRDWFPLQEDAAPLEKEAQE